MGIGDWGLGIGDWGLGPIPNPQDNYLIYLIILIILNNQKHFRIIQKMK